MPDYDVRAEPEGVTVETMLRQDVPPPVAHVPAPAPDSLSVVAACRHWLRRRVAGLQLPAALSADLELVASELVANAFLHARGPRSLWLQVLPGHRVRVSVHDAEPTPPLPRSADATETRGRGLRVVAALSDRWGSSPDAHGKAVWAELAPRTHDGPGEQTGPRG